MSINLQEQIASLTQTVQQLTIRLNQQKEKSKIEEHRNVNVSTIDPAHVSLDIFKSLPEFSGDRNGYATWRTMTTIAMQVLANHRNSMRYYEALMIVRKITGAASNVLNNYNTAFNFEAIINRLDFVYADKRPMYILEQELSTLQQNESTLDQFYDEVNKKLNSIISKINILYTDPTIANTFIENASIKALRTFITGLAENRGQLLYAANPNSLPEAYACLQTIIADQERMKFAIQYNQTENDINETEIDESLTSQTQYTYQDDQLTNPDELIEVESEYQKTIVEDDYISSSDDDKESSIFLGD